MTKMVKYGILIAMMIAFGQSQRRPTYAGTSNHRFPAVLPQYLSEPQPTASSPVDNRIGGSTSTIVTPSVQATTITANPSANTEWSANIDWINTWDHEKQPFWYLNWQHIQQHIGAKLPPPTSIPDRTDVNL